MAACEGGSHAIVDLLARAGAMLSTATTARGGYSLHDMVSRGDASPQEQAAVLAMLKKHGVISTKVPSNLQSKYYFQDG
jgi:nicotinic acid phosphoribosyltransferase